MNRTCREVEALIDRRAAGLDEAERLVLEQHLGECESCRELTQIMRQVVTTIEAAPDTLSESARERAMSRAFANVAAGSALRSTHSTPKRVGMWLAAAAALLVAGRLALHDTTQPEATASGAPAHVGASQRAADKPSELANAPTHADRAVARAPEAESVTNDDGWIDVRGRETRVFANARVELAPGSRMRFREGSALLELERGRAQVDVDASRNETFSVLTRNFKVQVLGTAFAVSPERVEVQRGRVQVFDRRGHVLARELSQGATFTYRAPETKRDRKPTNDVEISAQTAAPVGALLARARAALAAGDVEGARASISEVEQSAEQSAVSRSDRAEAQTLRAECALLERDPAAAAHIYLGIARQFSDLSSGENAAFAAAQLKARAGDKSGARSLFERYLAQYPEGRFASEARARIAADTK